MEMFSDVKTKKNVRSVCVMIQVIFRGSTKGSRLFYNHNSYTQLYKRNQNRMTANT